MPREALFMSIYRKREFKLFENISRSQGGPMGGFSEEVTSQFVTCIRECDLSASRVGGLPSPQSDIRLYSERHIVRDFSIQLGAGLLQIHDQFIGDSQLSYLFRPFSDPSPRWASSAISAMGVLQQQLLPKGASISCPLDQTASKEKFGFSNDLISCAREMSFPWLLILLISISKRARGRHQGDTKVHISHTMKIFHIRVTDLIY